MAGAALDGHVALITGGSSGIGLGMARALLDAGAGVPIWGRSAERNRRAGEQLGAGDLVRAWECDVGDEAQVGAAFAAVVDHFGTVDSCFANAAVGGAAVPFVELGLEEWRDVLRTNLDGAFLTTRAAARHMV